MNALLGHRLTWPLVTLALLLLVNVVANGRFLHIEWRDGHLYGSLIDILNRAAPLILVSLGMTLVIAMRGIPSAMASAGYTSTGTDESGDKSVWRCTSSGRSKVPFSASCFGRSSPLISRSTILVLWRRAGHG